MWTTTHAPPAARWIRRENAELATVLGGCRGAWSRTSSGTVHYRDGPSRQFESIHGRSYRFQLDNKRTESSRLRYGTLRTVYFSRTELASRRPPTHGATSNISLRGQRPQPSWQYGDSESLRRWRTYTDFELHGAIIFSEPILLLFFFRPWYVVPKV